MKSRTKIHKDKASHFSLKKHNKPSMESMSGYTLVELMVVVSIIVFISSLTMVALKTARIKGRDTKRIADLNNVAKALELYYADNKRYPDCTDVGYSGACNLSLAGIGNVDSSGDNSFMSPMVPKYITRDPKDPSNSATTGYVYVYGTNLKFPANASSTLAYFLAAPLETVAHPQLKGTLSYGDATFGQYYSIGVVK